MLKSLFGRSEPGTFLNLNEDAFDYDTQKMIYVLVDAFGGGGAGDVLAKKVTSSLIEEYGALSDDRDSTMPFFYDQNLLIESNMLLNALYSINKKIIQENEKVDVNRRAGCSLGAMCVSDSILNVITVGNIRTYLLRDEMFYTLGQERSSSFISGHENPSLVSIPLSCVGMYPSLQFHVYESRIMKGDIYLSLTDGFFNLLRESDFSLIREWVKNKSYNSFWDKLTDLVNKRGNVDNQSLLLLRY